MPLNVPLALYVARCASASSAMKPYRVRAVPVFVDEGDGLECVHNSQIVERKGVVSCLVSRVDERQLL
jgi:hypothetical protein